MHKTQMGAALHHLVRGHRRVEPPGEQTDEAARGVGRKSTGPDDAARVYEQGAARDFDPAR